MDVGFLYNTKYIGADWVGPGVRMGVGGVRVKCGRCADLFELYCIWIMASYIIDIRKTEK